MEQNNTRVSTLQATVRLTLTFLGYILFIELLYTARRSNFLLVCALTIEYCAVRYGPAFPPLPSTKDITVLYEGVIHSQPNIELLPVSMWLCVVLLTWIYAPIYGISLYFLTFTTLQVCLMTDEPDSEYEFQYDALYFAAKSNEFVLRYGCALVNY